MKTLTVILLWVFLFTGTFGWAKEARLFSTAIENKSFSSYPVDNNKLAPESRLNSEDFKYSLTVTAICKHVEHDGNLDDKSYLNDVLARLDAEKNSNITVLPYEIVIEIPNEELAVRYFDPTKTNVITPYSDISKLQTKIIAPRLHRQIIHRITALPAYSSSNEPVMRRAPFKRTVKVALCWMSKIRDESKVDEPLAVSTLSGVLKKQFKNSVEISTIHHVIENGTEGIIARLRKEKPDIVGLSLFFNTLDDLAKIMDYLKSLPSRERPLIILGNVLATYNADLLLTKYPEVIVCKGEGEEAIKQTVRYFKGEVSLPDVPNIAYMHNGQITVNSSMKTNLVNAGVPQRDVLSYTIDSGGAVFMETSRECPFNCAICARKPFLGKGGWRGRAIDDVINDLVVVCDHGGRFVNFVDEDLFAGGVERVVELADRIIALKKSGRIPADLTFGTSASTRLVYKAGDSEENNNKRVEAFKKLKEAGLSVLFIGIESGSPSQLKRYGKAATVFENKKALEIIEGLGIHNVPGFIMFDPLVTLQELRESIAFLRETGMDKRITYPIKSYIPLRGASYTSQLIEKGLVDPNEYDPNALSYEYVYENSQVVQVLSSIKDWEESQQMFFWVLKIIFRSSKFGETSDKERGILKKIMAEQTVILLDYLEDMVRCETEYQMNTVAGKYSERLVKDILGALSYIKSGDITIDAKHLERIAYRSIAREMIRTYFAEKHFLVEDIKNKIANLFNTELEIEKLNEALKSFQNEGRIEFLNGSYHVTDVFWEYKEIPEVDLPRPSKDEFHIANSSINPKPKVAFFDLDGTLIDTMPNAEIAFGKIYHYIIDATSEEPFGEALDRGKTYLYSGSWKTLTEHIAFIISMSFKNGHSEEDLQKVADMLVQRLNIDSIDKTHGNLVAKFSMIYEAILMKEFEAKPPKLFRGVRQLLNELQRAGIKMYIGTGTPQGVADYLVKKLNIHGYFNAVYGVNSTSSPFPQGKMDMLKTVKENNNITENNQIIIFGDSDGDMSISNIDAGNKCIAVGLSHGNEQSTQKLVSSGADFIMYNLKNWKFYWKKLGFPKLSKEMTGYNPERAPPTEPFKSFISDNKNTIKDTLTLNHFNTLIRIPIEAIESIGVDNIKDFLATFQESHNGYIELYYISGVGGASENIYQKYGLQKKSLPKDFKRTRENTVTLFPALKGEEVSQSSIVSKLGNISMTPDNTILSPIGLQHDPAGLIRATILGLKMMDIARQIKEKGIAITHDQAFKDKIQIEILEQLKNVCDVADLKNFNLTPDDIIALATGNINNIIIALKKLIKLLPITPIDANELRQIYEHVKEVIAAA
ncbi:MAG: HAD hydrolase-like protein [Candidatus Omnitrophica bacterium]|nr:HAD hydrolase-like protein [Candidatus Omnitrophota bacterium]